jgi:hypothetical protein
LADGLLLKYLGLMVLYEVVFNVIWSAVDPQQVTTQLDRLAENSEYYVCTGNSSIFPILSLFSKAALMIWGVYISLKTRKIVQYYSESRFIGVAVRLVLNCESNPNTLTRLGRITTFRFMHSSLQALL